MKKLALVLAGASLAFGGAAASAQTISEKGEAKLARMLAGRVAGEPMNCINANRSNRIQVIEYVGIVYDAGSTIWVARPLDPRMLDRWDVPVIQRFGSQLCTNDIIRTVDRSTGHITGSVFLTEFVPYRRG